MITAYLSGGIGNQMFQYAYGLELAKRFNTELVLDVSILEHYPLRRYALNLFKGVSEKVVTTPNWHDQIWDVGKHWNQRIKNGDAFFGNPQNEDLFPNVREELQRRFVPRWSTSMPQKFLNQIKSAGENSVMVGVRRGDYLLPENVNSHGVLPLSYYEKAIQVLADKGINPVLFIFSDEPEWCESLRFGVETHIYYGDITTEKHLGHEDIDIELMSNCRHAILANSSFHWWGAWLGPDQVGTVIGPKNWILADSMYSNFIMPKRWIKL